MAAEINESLHRLQSLQQDLVLFSEHRIVNIDRLFHELEDSIEDLKRSLQKKRKNEESRNKLIKSKDASRADVVEIGDLQFSVNNQFKEFAIQVADMLDLDEVESMKLCLAVHEDLSQYSDRTPYEACLRYHVLRSTTLDCLRMVLSIANEPADGDIESELFKTAARQIVQGKENRPSEASAYWRKCLTALTDVEDAVRSIRDRHEKLRMTGEALLGDVAETLHGGRIHLLRQHQSLGAILAYLVQSHYAMPEDFRALLSKASELDGPMDIIAHYLPALISAAAHFGGPQTVHPGAADLHKLFAHGPGKLQWKNHGLQAVATICWLAEYSSREEELSDESDKAKASKEKEKIFFEALTDKPLHFILAICNYLKPEVWHDPAKVGLMEFLLDEYSTAFRDTQPAEEFFCEITMQELQVFSDAFIANMPDILRQLKMQEDSQRRDWLSQPDAEKERYEPHFERVMMIIAYAYDDDPEAAQDWWNDRDGNLYGFLRWASQRLPTPRVATFCELLRAIASDEKSANDAHKFLLEDASLSAGKLRKVYAVSWAQIFSELDIFSQNVKNTPAAQPAFETDSTIGFIEPETTIMLDAYLRLVAHMCRSSPDARSWILRDQPFPLPEIMLQLSHSGLDDRLQACCLEVLSALLTEKIPEVNDGMWVLIDNWISGKLGQSADTSRPQAVTSGNPFIASRYLMGIARDSEAAVAFLNLLNQLLVPTPNPTWPLSDALPFPEQLGASSRHGGIDLYVDFVLGYVFPATVSTTDPSVETTMQCLLQHACLDFILLCLSTFNENLVILANTSSSNADSASRNTWLINYVRLHPFARVMDYVFSDKTITPLFAAIQKGHDFIDNSRSNSPAVQVVVKALRVMNLIRQLQATYFDVVRPIVKTQHTSRPVPVANPALSSFDDVMVLQIGITVVDIVNFVVSKHEQISMDALTVLQQLASSRKFAAGRDANTGLSHGNRLVGQIQENSDVIALGLIGDFLIDQHDLEAGQAPFKITRAMALLDLLNGNLDVSPDTPNLAHCLLGFSCGERAVNVAPDSLLATGKSLFNAIVQVVIVVPVEYEGSMVSWLLALRRKALDVVVKLALSRLTKGIVFEELERVDFHQALAAHQIPVGALTVWDGLMSNDREALIRSASTAIRDFVYARHLVFEYTSSILRTAVDRRAASLQSRITSTMLGKVNVSDTEITPVFSIFDLFDFFDIETGHAVEAHCNLLTDLEYSLCAQEDRESGFTYNMRMVQELCAMRRRELQQNSTIRQPSDEAQANDDTAAVEAALISQNNWHAIRAARVTATESWTELLSLLMINRDTDAGHQESMALKGLQMIVPRFERAISGDANVAALLAKLMLTMVKGTKRLASSERKQDAKPYTERLLSAFRVCLKASVDSTTDTALRDVCYRICCTVVDGDSLSGAVTDVAGSQADSQLLQLVQMSRERLIAVLAEDAFSGRGPTRISSLLFLDAVVGLYQGSRKSSQVLRNLARLNFLPVLLDNSIGNAASAFDGAPDDVFTKLSCFHAAMNLTLRVSASADGARLVLASNFFQIVEDSCLFSTDPDIGLDVDNPAALRAFYKLLSAVLKIVTSLTMTARQLQNVPVMHQAKTFLEQNRFSMQAVFKRTSTNYKTSGPPEDEALEVAGEFEKLLLITGFLDDDDPVISGLSKSNGFT